MIGLDTNVIVRYVVRDDPEQTEQADAVFDLLTARQPGFVSTVVLAELWWVLDRHYHYERNSLIQFLEYLLQADELRIQDLPTAQAALDQTATGADFADALIAKAAQAAGCEQTVSFDKRARRAGIKSVADLLATEKEQQ